MKSRLTLLCACAFLASFSLSDRSLRAQAEFIRGDTDGSGELQITDGVQIFGFLFLGNPVELSCEDAADADDSGLLNISDGIYILNFLFLGGPPPPSPFPDCGPDPTEDALTCVSFGACPIRDLGACCLRFAGCVDGITLEECERRGGVFGGVGTECGTDENGNVEFDFCEEDCNGNGTVDGLEISDGRTLDCNGNGVPDDCEEDCDGNGIPDDCDLREGAERDCDGNGLPDSCDIASGRARDCDRNGLPDTCDIAECPPENPECGDCDRNGIPDVCDIAECDGRPECLDCDTDGRPDGCSRCFIPGDLDGDFVVTANDMELFLRCFQQECAELDCACADVDRDGDIDADDETLLFGIIEGLIPQVEVAITNFEPKMALPGVVVTIEGIGFERFKDPDNLCIVAMDQQTGDAVPFQALAIEDGRILAEVGAQAMDDVPGRITIAEGVGAFGPLELDNDLARVGEEGAWVWRFNGGAIAMADELFTPCAVECTTVAGALVAGDLCLTFPKGCLAGDKLEIFCRAWDHTTNPPFGVDGYIGCLEILADQTALQCATTICNAIVALYASQTPPVTINCNVTAAPGGAAKITMSYPAPRTITWGRLSVSYPRVEIEVNNTAAGNDDYVTWSTTPCRVRVTGLAAGAGPRTVVLTNDAPGAIPGGGNVRFRPGAPVAWPPNTTATATTLTLTLPASGAWVPFGIAGEFGSPSTNDKDTVIEAHANTATGPICCRIPLMVRVRKNINSLTTPERDRYLQAVSDLNAAGNYLDYQTIHSISTNQAHGGPGFLPWHRAFILDYERNLQRIDPSVSLHYWDFTSSNPALFAPDFMGSNTGVGTTGGNVMFAPTNPLSGWMVGGVALRRGATNNHLGTPTTQSDATTLLPATFAAFRSMEINPHGNAHVWIGGWMGFTGTAVRDPIFFLLHSNVDRLWAQWQSMGHHGSTVTEYNAQGTFSCISTFTQGHLLNDTMWPWNGATGPGTCPFPVTLDDRPAAAPGGALLSPAAPGFLLGPPSVPTPGDMIDYLGRAAPAQGHGFCYDVVPYN